MKHYCNFCKHFITAPNLDSYHGRCKIHAHSFPSFFRQRCTQYEYSKIANTMGIESLEYMEEWIKARRMSSELYRDCHLWELSFKYYPDWSTEKRIKWIKQQNGTNNYRKSGKQKIQ